MNEFKYLLFTQCNYDARYEDQFVMVNFPGDPTADLEKHSKLDRSGCNELQSQV